MSLEAVLLPMINNLDEMIDGTKKRNLQLIPVLDLKSEIERFRKQFNQSNFLGSSCFPKEILKKCSNSYTRLKNAIIENNISIGKTEDSEEAEKIVERKLLLRKWDRIEIKHFKFIMRSAFIMETIYRNNIFNSILYRYSIIRRQHKVNDIADKIIQRIMMNEIQSLFMLTRDLEEVGSRFNEHYFNPETSDYRDIPFVDLYDLILEKIDVYYHEQSDLLNKSVSDTIEEVTLSLLLLLQPDEKDVQGYIKDLSDHSFGRTSSQEKVIFRIKKEDPPTYSYLIDDLSLIKLRDIYLKYLQIKGKRIPNS